MHCELKNGKIIGMMPDGKNRVFNSIGEYEDAFWDMQYELNNQFVMEWPEFW